MARPLREEYPGALWHVTSRGNSGTSIFVDDGDRIAFLGRVETAVERYGWIIHAWVLMGTHFHFLIETPKPTLSSGMQWLNGCWGGDFNRFHDRHGHLFGGRFKSFLIERETYYLEVLRYIILNPVRAGMVEHPKDYDMVELSGVCGTRLAAAVARGRQGMADLQRDRVGSEGGVPELHRGTARCPRPLRQRRRSDLPRDAGVHRQSVEDDRSPGEERSAPEGAA